MKPAPGAAQVAQNASHMRRLLERLEEIEQRLRAGGGLKKIEKQHRDGKLTARERLAHLLDPDGMFLEIGLLVAYDKYDGQAPGAGVVTGVGRIEGRPAVVVANDATVKAGAWWPETITKILRAQEIAMRNRVPIVYRSKRSGPCRGVGSACSGRILTERTIRRSMRSPTAPNHATTTAGLHGTGYHPELTTTAGTPQAITLSHSHLSTT